MLVHLALYVFEKSRCFEPGHHFDLHGSIDGASALTAVVFAAVTGYATGDEQERALAAGFDSFLVKPLEPESLGRLLRAAVSRSA